ncbi:EF-hand calcium-binding domain-containing protein 9-like [Watersipora subatra]|uniref:EF-hand calcium-binding domain-containing protein 9-like n=1 Tax=Watersipora subatra TaxID=2589382 RepID=UPI00355BF85D
MKMKVTSKLLQCVHPDKTTCLLSGKNVKIILELFNLLDIHEQGELNDILFYQFMKRATDMKQSMVYKIFDMLDFDGSGQIDFNEFYVIICIIVAVKDSIEKQFIYSHSRTVFDFLNEDASNAVSVDEFINFGFLFNFREDAIKDIFKEFDLSGDQELDYKEFRMFAMACIDRQNEIDKVGREKAMTLARQKAIKEKKKKLLAMKKDGSLAAVLQSIRAKGQTVEVPNCLLEKTWSWKYCKRLTEIPSTNLQK